MISPENPTKCLEKEFYPISSGKQAEGTLPSLFYGACFALIKSEAMPKEKTRDQYTL